MTTVTPAMNRTVQFNIQAMRQFTGTVEQYVAYAVVAVADPAIDMGDDTHRIARIRAILTAADIVRAEQREQR